MTELEEEGNNHPKDKWESTTSIISLLFPYSYISWLIYSILSEM